jgi:hypothetical protein
MYLSPKATLSLTIYLTMYLFGGTVSPASSIWLSESLVLFLESKTVGPVSPVRSVSLFSFALGFSNAVFEQLSFQFRFRGILPRTEKKRVQSSVSRQLKFCLKQASLEYCIAIHSPLLAEKSKSKDRNSAKNHQTQTKVKFNRIKPE